MPNINDHYLRQNPIYPLDKVSTPTYPSYVYEGKVTHTAIECPTSCDGSAKSVRLIDGTVRLESVEEKVREIALKHFDAYLNQHDQQIQSQKSKVTKGWRNTFVGGAIAVGVPYAMGFAATATAAGLAAPLAIVAGGTLALTGIKNLFKGYGQLGQLKKDQTTLEQNKAAWNDPLVEIIEKRRNAGNQGFKYVLNNGLKGTIIHPKEVQDLWVRDFSKLLQQPKNAPYLFEQDLLGTPSLTYAWEQDSLPELHLLNRFMPTTLLQAMTSKYRELRNNYLSFNDFIERELTALHHYENQQRDAVNTLRANALRPARQVRDLRLAQAGQLYREAIAPFIREKEFAIREVKTVYSKNDLETAACRRNALSAIEREFKQHPSVIAIEQAYANDQQRCHFLYQQSKLMADSHFDHRLQKLHYHARLAKDLIEKQRNSGVDYYNRSLESLFQASSEAAIYGIQNMPSLILNSNWRWNDINEFAPWHADYTPAQELTREIFGAIGNLFRQTAASTNPGWDRVWDNLYTHQAPFTLKNIPNNCPSRLFCQPVAAPIQRHAPVGNKKETQTSVSYGSTRGRGANPSNKEEQTTVATKKEGETTVSYGPTRGRGSEAPKENAPVGTKKETQTSVAYGSTKGR